MNTWKIIELHFCILCIRKLIYRRWS